MKKFDSISREISRQVTNKEGEFQLRLDEFNLAKILANFVYFAKKQGIVLRKSGITFKIFVFMELMNHLLLLLPLLIY